MILFKSMVCMLALLILASPLSAVQSGGINFRAALRKAAYKDGELIVKFKKHAAAKSVHRGVGGSVKASMRLFGSDLVSIPAGLTLKVAISRYQADPNVEYAEPNYLVRKAAIPNDPLFPSQWNMTQISAPQAWNTFTGSNAAASKIVAILDTGIDYTHPDLAANLWTNPGELPGNGLDDDGNGIVDDYYGANFNNNLPISGDPKDDDTADAHGTHVAGIIGAAGNNGVGTSGINWSVRLMAVKFLHGPEGFGELADVLKGVEYALSKGAKIINCSFEIADEPSAAYDIKSIRDAVLAADAAHALVISAAGNTGSNLDFVNVYPASVRTPNNIAVAATGSSDGLSGYSDYGKTVIDLAAPGGDSTDQPSGVLSTVTGIVNPSGYRTTAGTSMAAPHVSGLAALIWNLYPNLTHYQVKARILNSVDRLDSLEGKVITSGRINAARALAISDLPAVFNVTPNRLIPETRVTITGANFGSSQGNVTIGGLPMAVSSWSDSAITADVPSGATSGSVIVNGFGSSFPLTIPDAPSVTLSGDQVSGVPSLPVVFTAEIKGAEVRIVSYEWNFGDGIFRTIDGITTSATHIFEAAETFTVQVRITDDLGRKATGETKVYVGTTSQGNSGGGCFIATAAWGSALHPRVAALRRFRDNFLMTNLPGRMFVWSYYAVSPPLADFIARHELLRQLVRCGLSPLVALAEIL